MPRAFPRRLHHDVPSWIDPRFALFHIRIALAPDVAQRRLTDAELAPLLLQSVRYYEHQDCWKVMVFLLMPSHLHALLAFGPEHSMSKVVQGWKRYHARRNRVVWQEGYFDHRLREDERGEQMNAKIEYIRRNPVAAGLCPTTTDWPWVVVSES